MKLIARLIAFAILSFAAYSSQASAQAPVYIGWEKCETCHKDHVAAWKKTRHHDAFDSLKNERKERNLTCVPCHTVGYGAPSGFMDIDITPHLAGVQCESCHGPGKAHADAPMDGGVINPAPAEAVCRECHTKGQDSAFDYEFMSKIVHRIKKKQ